MTVAGMDVWCLLVVAVVLGALFAYGATSNRR
jgi:hypothetical protein